ncbi:MAG TPA: response regulator [Bryobacteraceae bacterium]|nr:response regulator [Bryobacteraceae bacterium]
MTATRLLIVEDNPVDVRLLRYALDHQTWDVETTVADDGEKAITLLLHSSEAESGKPDFIILDWNLPKRDGGEVLHVIRNEAALRDLPVAILSSSPMDLIRGRMARVNVRANCYFTKPLDVDDFIALGRRLHVCYRLVLEQRKNGHDFQEIEAAELDGG